MKEEEHKAEDLVRFVTALRDGQEISAPASIDVEQEVFTRNLVGLARRIQPEHDFVQQLGQQLAADQKARQSVAMQARPGSIAELLSFWRQRMGLRRQFLYRLGIAVVLLVSVLAVTPLLAQFALEHFVPRTVDKWPLGSESITLATIPPEARSTNIERLEEQAGFSTLVPTHIPSGCRFVEGSYLAEPVAEIRLLYQSSDRLPCFDIVLRRADDTVHRPYVGAGAVEEITVKGERALYISGMWVIEGPIGEKSKDGVLTLGPGDLQELYDQATWIEGPKQVVFEYEGLLIRITGGANISKEELVKVAESVE